VVSDNVTIPDRLTFKRKEVIKMTKLDGKVLDFWENEIGGFKVMSNQMEEQFYSRQDVETILKIKQLLIVERKSRTAVKAAIASALPENAQDGIESPKVSSENVIKENTTTVPAEKLNLIRKNLQDILTILEKNDIY